MAENVKIVAQSRGVSGSAPARRLRREGWLPCVFCDADGKSSAIQVRMHEFELLLERQGRDNLLADLEVDGGKAKKTLLKELQLDPVHGHLLHADFMEISMTEKMRVQIAVKLTGESVGVTNGGVLDRPVREIEVECLPGDLVESIDVDISGLEIGHSIHISDITLDSKLTLVSPDNLVVASVAARAAEEEPAAAEQAEAAAATEEGAEPELIRDAKKDKEEQSEAAEGEKGSD